MVSIYVFQKARETGFTNAAQNRSIRNAKGHAENALVGNDIIQGLHNDPVESVIEYTPAKAEEILDEINRDHAFGFCAHYEHGPEEKAYLIELNARTGFHTQL